MIRRLVNWYRERFCAEWAEWFGPDGMVLRRWQDGRWVTRPMTPSEQHDYVSRSVW